MLNSNLNTRFYFSGAGNTALQTVLNDDNIRYRLQINPDGAARVYESSVGGGNPWTGDTLITNSALLSRHVRQISVTNYENIYLKTTETAISIIKPEELASVGVVGLEFGGGDNCYWVFTSLVSGSNVTTGRKYARNFYIGTYKITLALSEDLSTLYAKSTATANVDDCRFRRLFVLTYT